MDFSKKNLKILDGAGKLSVGLHAGDLDEPLTRTDKPLLALGVDVAPGQALSLGHSDTVKVSFGTETAVALRPFWSGVGAVRDLACVGLDTYFDDSAHGKRLILLFDVGGEADASAKMAASFGVLSAGLTIGAGADARYLFARSFADTTTATEVLKDFFTSMRLPGQIAEPLADDEVIVLEYGGYASLGASLGYGYQIKGAPSFEVGQLRVTESYAFSLMAKAGLSAKVAGRFRIAVRAGSEAGWVRVDLHRTGTNTFAIAADVKATATLKPTDFPATTDELLEALLGLRARNFLNLLQDVRTYTDFGQLQSRLDTLAEGFIEKLVGKGFDELEKRSNFDELLGKAHRVADAYARAGDHAIALFDRYYDPATKNVQTALKDALKQITKATQWKRFEGDIDPTLWAVVNQLTGGDPLGFALKIAKPGGVTSLAELQNRASDILDQIQSDAHKEILEVIALAKSHFPLDGFVTALAGVDGPALRTLTARPLLGFVERITGKAVKGLSASEVGQVARRVNEVLGRLEEAKKTFHTRIVETLTQSAEFELHAGYSRAREHDALVSVEIDLRASELIRAAAHGDFATVLASASTGRVRVRDGVLTRKLQTQSKLSVHVVGWHTDWIYDAVDRLLVESEQRIVAEEGNQLTVMTTIEMQREKETKRGRDRARERIYTNLVLRFLGESSGAVAFDAKNRSYLIDSITGMSSRYQLVFDDERTTPSELAQYLSFADDFGLATSDAAAEAALGQLLPRDANGDFGRISVSYDVRFTEAGLQAFLQRPFAATDEARIRRLLRLIVLGNYVSRSHRLAQRGWAYWTPGVREQWKSQGPNFASHFAREFSPIAPSPLRNLTAPPKATLDGTDLRQLDTLYRIEDSLVKAFSELSRLLALKNRTPAEYEKGLSDFGTALKHFDSMDEGENTMFAVLDRMIQDAWPPSATDRHRNSSMTVKSRMNGAETTRVLVA